MARILRLFFGEIVGLPSQLGYSTLTARRSVIDRIVPTETQQARLGQCLYHLGFDKFRLNTYGAPPQNPCTLLLLKLADGLIAPGPTLVCAFQVFTEDRGGRNIDSGVG